jgi:mRNA interferase MazF
MARIKLEAFDIVVVPFPFTDRAASKRRPALVVSTSTFNQTQSNSVLAMITSAEQTDWLGDYAITDLKSTGLTNPCVIRLKLFTLDHRIIIRKAGLLGTPDQRKLKSSRKNLLGF